ncbi:hypothetical protein PstZobell_17377 [Stutzerimonas stutzeri ATCC 14405 = CCUG 16156]|uniref:hypothetical protein n=1 Tax=Stutzerimonas stutzeri TaxID=316 RepID=UPI0002548EFA|nr:hypothetical protein [Stutzerimonas stutzeri]EHY79196.1 hypothetical protein PstZobell_17377 [Stutzerimonas stutzeri ATCC 14405 = CCUG 16156]QOZ94806.1 hypothetical protein Pstu14405_05315 [Stutzerimonas stutzeri]
MDNAAARLLRILQKAKEVSSETQCRKAWEAILPLKHPGELIEKLGKVMALSGAAARLVIAAHPEEQDAVDHWQKSIQNGFTTSALSSKWSEFIKHIDTHTINYLKSHSRLLDYEFKQSDVSTDTLDRIRDLISESKEELLKSGLSQKIRLLLNDRLSDIISSIEDYQITGFDEVFDRANIVIAQILQLPEKDRGELKDSSAGEKISTAMSVITDTAEAISATLSIGNAITKLLGNN